MDASVHTPAERDDAASQPETNANTQDAAAAAQDAANTPVTRDAAAPDMRSAPATPPAPGPGMGLVGYWSMDEGSGASLGTGAFTATKAGGIPSFAPGRYGWALDLKPGTYFAVPPSGPLDALSKGQTITVAAWAKPRSFDPVKVNFIVSRQQGDGPAEHFGLGFRNGGYPFFDVLIYFADQTMVGDDPLASGKPARSALGAWTHLAGTYDGATVSLFVDGTQVATAPCDFVLTGDSTPLLIGANINDGAGTVKEYFDGLIDDVRIYGRVLSPSEIRALAEGHTPQ